MAPSYTLAELAARFALTVHGDPQRRIGGICALAPGQPGALAFLAGRKLRAQLATTAAAAVVVTPGDAPLLPGAGLLADEPQVAFARIAALFDLRRQRTPGISPQAVIAPTARLGPGVQVEPFAHIDVDAEIGADCYIGPGCVIGAGVHIGDGCRLEARVTVAPDCVIGSRCVLESGAVIGSRGFGNALGRSGWVAVPQLGRVVIGNDVEVGANTSIDRGAIDDTVIEDNVRIDNLVQIAHNCRIGAHTAIAACTGIAGSTRVGRRCMIGGGVGIGGHLSIADDVVILGMAMVTHSLNAKGVYGSGLPVDAAGEWRRTVARVRRLERFEARLKGVEHQLKLAPQGDLDND